MTTKMMNHRRVQIMNHNRFQIRKGTKVLAEFPTKNEARKELGRLLYIHPNTLSLVELRGFSDKLKVSDSREKPKKTIKRLFGRK